MYNCRTHVHAHVQRMFKNTCLNHRRNAVLPLCRSWSKSTCHPAHLRFKASLAPRPNLIKFVHQFRNWVTYDKIAWNVPKSC